MKGLPKGSYVVPFWVCYVFLIGDCNILPKKELHRRVWVGSRVFEGLLGYVMLIWSQRQGNPDWGNYHVAAGHKRP